MPDLYLPAIPLAERPARCAEYNHPGSTYNPHQDRTWCLCGAVVYDGDTVDWDLTKNLGPLSLWQPRALIADALRADS